MDTVTWTCECGLVEARVPARGARVVCYCESCRAFVERLGCADRLDAEGGNDLFQVDPSEVKIVAGADRLAYLRVTEKGPLRWYATCCNTPMANTLATRAVAFASFQSHDLRPQEGLPEVGARVNLRGATGHVEGARGSVWPMILGLLGRTLRGYATGAWRRNPFFDASGKPIAVRADP